MLFMKITVHLSCLWKQRILVLIQANIFYSTQNWYFVSKMQEYFEYFLIHSNGMTNGMLCSVQQSKHSVLGEFKATDSRMAVHPARCIQQLCLCVLAIALALCLSLLDDTAAMVKNRQKEQQDIVRFWSVCQQWQNVVFSSAWGSCWLLLVLGEPEHIKMCLKFFQLVWKPWVSERKVMSHAPAQTFLSWRMILWVTQRKKKSSVVKDNRKTSSAAACQEDTCRAAAGVEGSRRLHGERWENCTAAHIWCQTRRLFLVSVLLFWHL